MSSPNTQEFMIEIKDVPLISDSLYAYVIRPIIKLVCDLDSKSILNCWKKIQQSEPGFSFYVVMEIIKRENKDKEFWRFFLLMTHKYCDSYEVELDPSLFKLSEYATKLVKCIAKLYQIVDDNKSVPTITKDISVELRQLILSISEVNQHLIKKYRHLRIKNKIEESRTQFLYQSKIFVNCIKDYAFSHDTLSLFQSSNVFVCYINHLLRNYEAISKTIQANQ